MYTRIILTITAYFFNGNDTKYYKLELSPNKSELYIYIYIYIYTHTHTHEKRKEQTYAWLTLSTCLANLRSNYTFNSVVELVLFNF